jgi:hypothetical protein
MKFNNDPRIRIFIIGLIILIFVLYYLTKILSDSFLYKYLESFKSKIVINVLVCTHWLASIVLAFIVPDYLVKYSFFKNIFEDSQFWVHLATLCMFFISLIVLSVLLNILFYGIRKGKTETNNYGSH